MDLAFEEEYSAIHKGLLHCFGIKYGSSSSLVEIMLHYFALDIVVLQ